jgi:DNA-binding Lrp family transcriptional regulator
MPRFKMRVIPYEPEPKARIVLTKSKALPQRMREQPFVIGNSDSDYVCGNCDYLVLKSVTSEEVREIVYQCPICGIYNTLGIVFAYVLINVESGAEKEVLMNIKSIFEVKRIYMVYGIYDLILFLETKTMEDLRDVISQRIRRLDKVRSTMTLIIV